ncbi:hypothetical protein GCM10023191_036900 [Actinoallomurus oryzae]|uniref:Uncharacterized protein n=1 Tax=Actinoallomurus oryzae TaxID=502180 RepID=A0ABP8PZS9_9ACTN
MAVLNGAGSMLDLQDPAACQTQPEATREASDTIPANYLQLYRKNGQESGIA